MDLLVRLRVNLFPNAEYAFSEGSMGTASECRRGYRGGLQRCWVRLGGGYAGGGVWRMGLTSGGMSLGHWVYGFLREDSAGRMRLRGGVCAVRGWCEVMGGEWGAIWGCKDHG